MPLTHSGFGVLGTNEVDVAKKSLRGIGQTFYGGYSGSTAIEAVERYQATGASDEAVVKFAKEIGAQHGRNW